MSHRIKNTESIFRLLNDRYELSERSARAAFWERCWPIASQLLKDINTLKKAVEALKNDTWVRDRHVYIFVRFIHNISDRIRRLGERRLRNPLKRRLRLRLRLSASKQNISYRCQCHLPHPPNECHDRCDARRFRRTGMNPKWHIFDLIRASVARGTYS